MFVRSMSSALGVGSPLGWLWTRTKALAASRTAARRTSRGATLLARAEQDGDELRIGEAAPAVRDAALARQGKERRCGLGIRHAGGRSIFCASAEPAKSRGNGRRAAWRTWRTDRRPPIDP